ncbi:DUF445 family protein [Phorcysia thermohydrogeniphila]|uniref:Uncharacterized membrane protein YheB (UPF0754 family) n=1 Tax=Phorcysia thermohydrogeniphila TaxID=936138 RepID=A0A4R1GJT3_9BACT|nr:DUF445 family protein [Phorcysia thermohydrogeniphila]TCK04532.1 uncharacterized membrane protein YheB (UPF0754 family) [Phorcysia thermohydrogeniphila]
MIELLVPPTFGALIGYFTNYVAIKMLFRPLKPYYIFGKRVPFTPGLIPSKREKLAEAIAKVVKENLLTEEVIRKRLNEEKIRQSLETLVSKFIDELLLKGDDYLEEFVGSVGDEEIGKLLDFKAVEKSLEPAIEGLVKSLNGKSLEELLPPHLRKKFLTFIDEKTEEVTKELLKASKSLEFRDLLFSSVKSGVERLKAYVPIISDKFVDNVSEKLSHQLLKLIEEAAKSEELRFKLSKFIWVELSKLLSKPIDLSGERGENVKLVIREVAVSVLDKVKQKRLSEVTKERLVLEILSALKELLRKKKESLSKLIADRLLKIIEVELPVILESINLESLVKERVNSLPIEEVEEIVLRLIREELRYITLLGGVLGFLIGLSQLFIQ